jgi:NADH-quinone oxidoreductase subunit G
MELKMPNQLNFASSKKPVTAENAPKITIDGITVEFAPGDTIMAVAERAKVQGKIPRYCYHPALPIAASCRMCLVEVEKAPKMMTACSTPAADGMVVHTRSEKVLAGRKGVMDFLLSNHPLDCPVCDKAGECDLQDYNFEYGPISSGFKEEKRVYEESSTKKLSEKVTLNMNRCVHCERCVRFTENVTETHDLVMLNRGYHKELAAADPDRGLFNEYQGVLTDLCPVGALTFDDFRFKKRSWFLRKNPSICDGCSKGCNMEVHSEMEVVYRLAPVFNEKVNGHWMCDEGRVSYHTYADPSRVIAPLLQSKDDAKTLAATTWETTFGAVKEILSNAQSVSVIIGTDATNEEAKLLQEQFPKIVSKGKVKFSFNNGFVKNSQENKALDKLLRQSDKTPNTKGLEAQGLKPFDKNQADDLMVVFRHGRAKLPEISKGSAILWGVFSTEEVEKVQSSGVNVMALMPGLSTLEKTGSFMNVDGITQNFKVAIKHKGHALSTLEVLGRLHGNV